MTLRRIVTIAFAGLFGAALFFFLRTPATNAEAAYHGRPEIVAATFASAWCSSCRILKPRLAKVIPAFKNEPIAFVEFDFTFGARDETRLEAETYGVEDVYDRNKGATGFTLLVDRDTGEILDTLTINFSEDAMKSAISRAIALATYTDKQAESTANSLP